MKFEDYKNLVNKYYNKDCREINFQNRIIIPFLESIIPKEYDIVDSSTLYKNWNLYKDGQDRIGISRNSFAAKGTPDILITKDWELFAQDKSKPVLIIEIKRPTAIDRLHADSQVKEGKAYQATSAIPSAEVAKPAPKSYAELAREEARADLKKKRSAAYLTSDFITKKRSHPAVNKANTAISHQPTAFFQKENGSGLSKYSRNLKQDHYILADIKVNTSLPKESPKKSKNNYDFLKTSQIYNKKELQKQRERRIAQELNLTRLEEK